MSSELDQLRQKRNTAAVAVPDADAVAVPDAVPSRRLTRLAQVQLLHAFAGLVLSLHLHEEAYLEWAFGIFGGTIGLVLVGQLTLFRFASKAGWLPKVERSVSRSRAAESS